MLQPENQTVRIAATITVNDADRAILQCWARGRSTPARLVLRANIVLRAADGARNDVIAAELGTDRLLVGKWRKRFAEFGVAGIEKDAPRGGRKPAARDAVAGRIIEWTTQRKPGNATHWSTRTLARALGTSRAMVNRVWRANGLKPHLSKTFKVSNDRRFEEKLVDVVGLYMNPPERALVLSVDEMAWLKRHPRFHMHFTPTSSSWLNMVERWFRNITDQRIRRGTFNSVSELIDAIEAYIKEHNRDPKPFVWTAKADQILAKVKRARAVLDKMASA
jgi:transposase